MFFIGVLVGVLSTVILLLISVHKNPYKYIFSPFSNKPELNWTTRQLLQLISGKMADRWYEARTHCRKGFWMSLGCAFGLFTIIRISMQNPEFSRGKYYYIVKLFPVSLEKVEKITDRFVPAYPDKAMCLAEVFVAGQNIVYNWFSGWSHWRK